MSIDRSLTPPRTATTTATVLIAEDDPVVARLVAELVRQNGWRPLIAADAMQAVMFAVRGEPAAVVLDIQMPGGNGLQVLKKLKGNANTAGVPVVVLSGSTDPDLPKQVVEHGAEAFLPKPLDPQRLRAVLQAALEQVR